jgi:hypothetical protein
MYTLNKEYESNVSHIGFWIKTILFVDNWQKFVSSVLGIWSEQNRSQESLEKKLNSSPPPPVWTPKSAPPSPTVERKFRPVPFESPTLARKRVTSGATTSPPWSQPDYPDKPYQPSIIKSSSLNTISAPRIQQQNHVVFRKAKGNEQRLMSMLSVVPFCRQKGEILNIHLN